MFGTQSYMKKVRFMKNVRFLTRLLQFVIFANTLPRSNWDIVIPVTFKEEPKWSRVRLCMCYYYISLHNNREIYVQNASTS